MFDTLAAKWAELATQALLVLLVPRALGPSAYGEFAVAFGLVSVLSLSLGLGAPLAAIRYVPAARAEERLAQARAVAAGVARSRARMLALLTVAAAVAGPALLGVSLPVTLAVCLAAWCSVGSSIVSELGLALGRPRVWNARFPLENGLVVVAAVAGHAVAEAHGAIVGLVLACGATFALLLAEVAGELRAAPAGSALPAEAVGYARLQTVTVILGTLVKRGGPLMMPLAGASSAQTGFAAIATGLGTAGTTTMMSLLIVQLPGLVARRLRAPEAEAEAARTARAALAVGLAAAIPAALVAGPAIDLVLGSDFAGAETAVVLALPSVPLGVVLGLASLVAGLRLRPGVLTAAWAIGGAAFAGFAAATIPSLDAEGASVAMSGGLLVAALAGTLLLGGRAMRTTCAASVAGAAVVLAAGAMAA
jgi:O-antigen/teichoic acid export membrane protein